jgi:hypothetical protein
MKIQLTFQRLADECPKEGASIIYTSSAAEYSELLTGEVYYIWHDDDGGSYDEQGSQDNQETETQLAVCVDGFELTPSTLWADINDFNSKIDAANETYVCPHQYREICGTNYCNHCGEKKL